MNRASISAELPFPIAFMHRLIETEPDYSSSYQRMLDCYETLIRYCAMVQISDYFSVGFPNADLNRILLGRLQRNLALGHWIELVRQITSLQRSGTIKAFIPEMAQFYFRPGGETLTLEAEIFDSKLVAIRNNWAHPRETRSTENIEQKLEEHRVLLDTVLAKLAFLERYTLYVPIRGPRPGVIKDAFVLMGPNERLRVARDLNLQLCSPVREHLEYEMTAFLVSEADHSQQLLLYPLSVFANRGGAEDLFLLEACESHKEILSGLSYRGVRIGQKPLDIRPGSEYTHVIDRFRSLLTGLGAGQKDSAPHTVPAGEDSSSPDFAVQDQIIEEQTRTFVGRVYAQNALEEFVAKRPCGYFIVRGGPGQGKTAFLCQLVQKNGFIRHLINRTGGRADPRLILRSLVSQIAPRTHRHVTVPESIPDLMKLWEELLALASRKSPVVVAIDGLDELPGRGIEDIPYLITEGLPKGAYIVVTLRPGELMDRLEDYISGLSYQIYDLGPLELSEMREILRARAPQITEAELERIAEASQGNPLYLRAVVDELQGNANFNLHDLPSTLEGFFRRATTHLRKVKNEKLREVIGLLAVTRKPLSLRELHQIIGATQRETYEEGILPVRSFLLEMDGAYSFYHAWFHEFVTRKLLYEDELRESHRKLGEWLQGGESRTFDYRWASLAYHLFQSGDHGRLIEVINTEFLAEKVRRFGYAVLEDVELLARSFLEAGDPASVERCVAIVEKLRTIVGGDIIDDATRALRPFRPGPASFRTRLIAPEIRTIPGLDVYIGALPRTDVSADFFEVVPVGEQQLVIGIGDAPGAGLKSAFVARFLGNLLHQLVQKSSTIHVGEILSKLNSTIGTNQYFERISMQCVNLDPGQGIFHIANAGHPDPILYSARRGKCDILPLSGDLLHDPFELEAQASVYEEYAAEITPGDILVLLTDGLTEAHRLDGNQYGHRFTKIIEYNAGRGSKAIGEAILDDWRVHPRDEDYADDVTVVVITVNAFDRQNTSKRR
jgi:hypothetical protein